VKGKVAGRNPWKTNTLEWAAPDHLPHGNWGDTLPVVSRGPYEYGEMPNGDDYLPQDAPGEPAHATGSR